MRVLCCRRYIILETLLRQLPYPRTHWKTCYIAYSGGLDSTVLLHQLKQRAFPIHAIHINHQLQPLADDWATHCQQQCQEWKIPCTVKKIHAHKALGQSPEAAARTARYAAFAELLDAHSFLCLAHHQDDQAETLLLQLLRGAGVAGLAAMPVSIPFAVSYLLRPLLSTTRAELLAYAQQHQLNWIEDPSNQQLDFDRNYLRQKIMPLLQTRWPSAKKTIARSAEHCAQAAQLLTEIAAQDYQHVCDDQQLQISQLQMLPKSRRQQVLRYWLERCHLPSPSHAHLQQIQQQLLQSRTDAQPQVCWPGARVRRYRNYLYADQAVSVPDLSPVQLTWNLQQPLTLPHALGTLIAKKVLGKGLNVQRLTNAPITIRFRRGGERAQPQGRAHSQCLKKLWQEYGVPPWQRAQIPLLYCGEELTAALGVWISAPYAVSDQEWGWVINIDAC